MSEIIAVKSSLKTLVDGVEGLKRDLLLFDRIAIDRIENLFPKRRRKQVSGTIREL